jgi:putative ABC transport system permease protein
MPDWAREVRTRLAPLQLSSERELEIIDELSQHLEDRWQELMAGGASREEATCLALAEFTAPDALARRMASLRQSHVTPTVILGAPSTHLLSDAWRDFRYTLRMVSRQPGFASLVILTLTLGIGASTSMFSVVNGVLLEPLPYAEPERLVWIFGAFRGSDSAAVSPPDFLDYRRRNDVFERLGAMAIAPEAVTVGGATTPARMQASRVSAGLMSALGTAPTAGRDFVTGEEIAGAAPVIVSHRLWEDRFNGAPDVIGRSIVVDDRARTIVGVMPAGFVLPYDAFIRLTEPVDLFLPIAFDDPDAQMRRFHSLRLIGRLKADVSLTEAQAQMDVIARQLAAGYPENDTWHLRLLPLHERIAGAVRPVLLILMAAVTLLLLVACANVASLLLARASTREHELAVRGALGASRARIVRQLWTEGLVLSLAGAGAGLVVTGWTIVWLKRVAPARFPRVEAIALEPRVAAFALAVAVLTTVLFALAPAVHAARGGTAAALRPGRIATRDRSRRLGQRVLVVGQLAMSVILLATAALLVRSFVNLVSTDVGFNSAGVMLTPLPLPPERYETDQKVDAYYAALLERLTATPGIEAAALSTAPPIVGATDAIVYREGRPPATTEDQRYAQIRRIQGDYFGALGIRLTSGRTFDDLRDRSGAADVAIISQRTARDFFGADDPIGRRLVIDLGNRVAAEVVGVTADVRVFGQANEPPPLVYLHARQHPTSYTQVIVRSAGAPTEVASAIRRHVQALDPALAVSRVVQMPALLADSVAQPRFAMLLIGSFAVLAVVLTLVGLYGTLAYLVTRRQREIGIRLAVGATRGQILQLVIRQGALLIATGIPIGLLASLLTSRLASALLFNVRPADPQVLASVTVALAVASFAAVLVPAIRATRVEPLMTLRGE